MRKACLFTGSSANGAFARSPRQDNKCAGDAYLLSSVCQSSDEQWTECAIFLFRYPSRHVDRTDYEDSTGNLRRHVLACDPDETPENEMITSYAQGVTYSAPRVRFLLAMWCARRHRPFAIVDDPEFRELLSMLYARVQIPSRHTVSRDVQTIMDETRARVLDYFKVCLYIYAYTPYMTKTGLQGATREGPYLRGRLDVSEHVCVPRRDGALA